MAYSKEDLSLLQAKDLIEAALENALSPRGFEEFEKLLPVILAEIRERSQLRKKIAAHAIALWRKINKLTPALLPPELKEHQEFLALRSDYSYTLVLRQKGTNQRRKRLGPGLYVYASDPTEQVTWRLSEKEIRSWYFEWLEKFILRAKEVVESGVLTKPQEASAKRTRRSTFSANSIRWLDSSPSIFENKEEFELKYGIRTVLRHYHGGTYHLKALGKQSNIDRFWEECITPSKTAEFDGCTSGVPDEEVSI